ncbi:MAG: UDP-3-O-(3-hydroxymyristoyl)glucosamine N-acyltransferase [Bacteroidia bacterium]|nr:UDP-3-O-(3-hydroxymyristoyl)glucosamine N-acyltransferase [Bacteroidia bacterium]MBT8278961.1 UDP-3-O-(3-hydroxymyristoyl)glucosamine N-acyltransferase [Bacteroidia bacterium]NND25465.1 UDP-3-O-(3-hydroxymyristoyl)glucosamine N-acyltransferase [Flavobacteriaceae bacterium]NNK60635.1 UDP-3-O-(3-hydroxymyristoyl)glucosamine N-acyltransferase [Flavobacteriaceae bacterium]RZW53927.1 MAG: UDP-3-O-(3-hydroxymyristoyl)glucosamine N-acyltransferase [Flavobacteriaceae bacterium]
MRFPQPYALKDIADIIGCTFVGAEDFQVLGMNEIHVVSKGDIVFVDHPKYYDKALQSEATIVLINKEVECPEGKALLISDDPFRDFNILSNYFKPFVSSEKNIASSAKIGKNTVIQPNCFIGHNVVIGDNCTIHSNVSIYDDCVIGDHVTIHAGSVLGANAFYYKKRPEGHDRLLSCGRVVIEDHVDIGASCTIDRGVTADTTVKEGAKIDNQVQIGHDTVIGKKCLIASQVGIAGCTIIEDEVTIWGQVGITSGVTIGEKAVISAKAGVSKSLEGHKSYFGIPADDFRSKYKEIASIRKIPEILEMLKKK